MLIPRTHSDFPQRLLVLIRRRDRRVMRHIFAVQPMQEGGVVIGLRVPIITLVVQGELIIRRSIRQPQQMFSENPQNL